MFLRKTKRGVVQAMDAETGKTLWVNQVGSPSHPTTAVGVDSEHAAVLNGSTLYVYKRKDGSFVWKRRIVNVPGAGPAISGRFVFVPTISGVMEAYNVDLEQYRQPPWMYNSGGRAIVQPTVSRDSVSWATDRGLFYVVGSERLTIRFRTEAQDEIVSQAAYVPPFFYVGSLDGYLYKVHERSGDIAWRFSAGASDCTNPPRDPTRSENSPIDPDARSG